VSSRALFCLHWHLYVGLHLCELIAITSIRSNIKHSTLLLGFATLEHETIVTILAKTPRTVNKIKRIMQNTVKERLHVEALLSDLG